MRPFFKLIACLGLQIAGIDLLSAADTQTPDEVPDVLTNAAQVLNLTATQAAQALPVRLRGVVIDTSEPRGQALVLVDSSAGLYLSTASNIFAPYQRKDCLEVNGVTSAGQFAPCVQATWARKIGTTNIPAARPVTYAQLTTGALDAQYVRVGGVVRQVVRPAAGALPCWRLLLAIDGGSVPVRIPTSEDPKVQVDAEVTVDAICFFQFNQKRQALSPVLQVPRGVSVRVTRPPPADPYSAPIRTSLTLLQYSPENSYGHRIHVRGVVTHAQSAAQVWIRDETSSLRLQLAQTNAPQPGDEIDALGFQGYRSSTPVLEDVVFRKVKTLPLPTPLMLTNPAEAYEHQDDLVCLSATLTDIQPVQNGVILTLEQTGNVFKGVLKTPTSSDLLPAWQCGSRVRVAGICDVIYDDARPVMGIWHPQSFQILLRSPADLTVLATPPWWDARHVIYLLGIFTAGSLLVTGLVMMSARRSLKEQAHRRAMAEAEFAAILAERNRLSREIHDTLAQGLTATSVQLQLAKIHSNGSSGSAAKHIEQALQMVRGSLEEARNSIWNMRPQVLETGNLVAALNNILKQLSSGVGSATSFDVSGRARRLAAAVENNILRIGQESIANAVNHAQAKHIHVRLDFGEKQFLLAVEDDGTGFDAANPPPSASGLGLVGMKERAAEINAKLEMHSVPGQGTKIILCVPLTGE